MDLKKLLNQMTLDQKLGQLSQFNANLFLLSAAEITGPMARVGVTEEEKKTVGSVLNFINFHEVKKIQDKHLAEDPNKIPIIFMMDVIHGYRTIYPIPLALGCSFDTELVKECTKMAAREAAANGVHVTFTPMVDYVRDARWGRVMETCGEEPMLNSMMGVAQIEAFHGNDLRDPEALATCVKHFAGYGAAEAGKDYNTVELSEHVLREYYFPAYKACIDAGVPMLMPSFNSLNGIPSIANSWLMKDILRNEWGYTGIVISDFNAIGELLAHGIAANMKDAAKLAFDNTCDIEMCSSSYLHNMKELIAEGVFTEAQVDEAVLRVLELKDRMGLFEDPYHGASETRYAEIALCPEHRAIARKAAVQSAVLLKNNGVLPFRTDVKKVAIIGPFADNHEIIGYWSCNGVADESVTVAQGVANALPNAQITVIQGCSCDLTDFDCSRIPEAVAAAKDAEIVILCLGEHQNHSGESNNRAELDLPGVQNELAQAVIDANPNTAVLLFNGRPMSVTKLDRIAPAILDMWFPGTEGGNAAADLLFGKENPSGKVTMSFPKTSGQCPIYYNHMSTGRPKKESEPDDVLVRFRTSYLDCGNLPLYSFGHGLSYSDFVYGDLMLDADELNSNDCIHASVTVRNNSNIAGNETVQLYMRDMVGSTVRPVQQLIAFQKIHLNPYEQKTITFTVNEKMLRFWNSQNEFISEPGEFRLSVGYADHLIGTKTFWLK